MLRIHATCVQTGGTGLLLLGGPGSGKSDLALRLIDQPGLGAGEDMMRSVLVADDQVELTASDGALFAQSPGTLRGRLELRGVGVLRVPHVEHARVGFAVRLDHSGARERIPDFSEQTTVIAGISLPELHLDPFKPSTPAKIRAMATTLASGGFANHVDDALPR